MKTAILLIALATAVPALADNCSQSGRVGNSLIMAGDSERKVIEARPDREVRLETKGGGAAGYRFDFYQRDVTLQVYTRAGRVTRVCRIRD
jgi:hypothetical protein